MGTTASRWDNEERTSYVVECSEGWAWADFREAIADAYDLLGRVKQEVDFIMWFHGDLPPGDAMNHLKFAGTQPPNIRHTVMVNETGLFMEKLVKSVDRAEKWEGPEFVSTIEEARRYLGYGHPE